MKLIFDKSVPGRHGVTVPKADVPARAKLDPALLRSAPAELPEVAENDACRHFVNLSNKNFGVDTGFYPLGSCTMKYNPKINERTASLAGFASLHPLLPQLPSGETLVQGALEVLYNTERLLSEITGMSAFTLQPLAGSHGELTGVMLMAAYHRAKGNTKTKILIPDSAHGTNPASAAIAGYSVVSIPSDEDGVMCVDALKAELDDEVAGLMLTCPNTLGLFNPKIHELCDLIHSVDGLMYYDGANLNAVLGRCKPGELGFDICHLNLHKTFATPHGGGGPGSGAVGVVDKLVEFLPISTVERKDDGSFALCYDRPNSIGYIAPFYGNYSVLVRAYTYIRMLGPDGLRRVSENAVLNANYIRKKLMPYYDLPYPQTCKHECVFSATRQVKESDIHATDIAKGLIDCGVHPPTIYFPLIVPEAMMIEPTETESKETLDDFIETMIQLAETAKTDPASLHAAPLTTPVTRLDEVTAARKPVVADLGITSNE
ncbi:MAG: aminomethyl-transferring glycine dehydrogenase subunit GcvPB [Phycisphaerales bacterium]|nr:aminomethyl-transferring glycine dehydrogenase subunit GcvPB [Phycisphaerales bacterium]MBT7170500.1 aminomethyl-transferring glycine dehydrogenase subunit GcvPB [Phycisphaerales bacterium]